MKKNKNPVIVETLRISVGMTVCLALMLGVYLLIDKFETAVWLGGLVGTLVAVGNFLFMAIGLSNLAEDATEARIRIKTQSSFMIRTAAMLGILVVAVLFVKCDPLATALPLLFIRPVIMVEQFIQRSKTKGEEHES